MVTISNHSFVAKGETALLACVGQGFPSIEIAWMHNGQTIMNSSEVLITVEDVTQGGDLFKQSILQICNVQSVDGGDYTCVVSNRDMSATSSTTRLNVIGKNSTNSIMLKLKFFHRYRSGHNIRPFFCV